VAQEAQGQQSASAAVDVFGSVDAHYGYKFNGRDDLYRNFDSTHDSLTLGYAEVVLERKPTSASRVGFRTDLGFGPTLDTFSSPDPYQGSGRFLQQAYLSYLATDKVQFDVGKFVTLLGAEVIESQDNWNYSRSLLFALAIPYFHVGVRMTANATDKVTLAAHLVNGWNNSKENNGTKTLGASVTLKPSDKLTFIQNVMVGNETASGAQGGPGSRRFVSDSTLTLAVAPSVSLMANVDYGKEGRSRYAGAAAYARFRPNDLWAVASRIEWFDDGDALATGSGQTLKELTLTLERRLTDGLLTRLEVRSDVSNTRVFTGNNGSPTKRQNGVTLGFVYALSGKLHL
jgi:hypothetical protein